MTTHQRWTAVVAAGAALALSTALTVVGAAQAAPPGPTHTLADSHPRWATSGAALGAVAGSVPVTAKVYLAPRGGQAGLDSFVAAVSTPGTANYQRFLTASTYHQRFDPTRATVAAVTKFLTANGLKVTGTERFDTYLSVRGTAAAADRAFGTTLTWYRRDGKVVQAPATDLRLPEQIRSQVLGVTGLDTATNRAHPASPPPPLPPPSPGFINARPCSQYSGQLQATDEGDYSTPLPLFDGKRLSYAVCGFVPSQLRGAYGVEDGATGAIAHDGTGQTIAIIDAYAAPTIAADADEYSTRQGEPPFTPGQFSQVVPTGYTDIAACGPAGWYGEETLDVEAEHAMAPGADIRYYGAASCDDVDLNAALRRVVNDDVASIVSNSYGELESDQDAGSVVAFESVAKQAAAEGIGIDFSSGDDGDEEADSGLLQADYPASDPYVTAVGGTSTGIGAAGTRIYQTGWGTEKATLTHAGAWSDPEYLYGSGGGYSDLFPRPAYQLGVVPLSNEGSRAVPDVAADADPNTGILVGQTQTFADGVRYGEYRIGGTSVSSPLTAGMLADVQQAVGHRLGFADPLLYALAGAGSKGLTDVLPQAASAAPLGVVRVDYVDQDGFDPAHGYLYTVRTFDQDSSLVTTKGWDDVTGLGTPNVPGLIRSIRALR